jgi:chorismate mutase
MALEELRKQIDGVDAQLLELFKQRLSFVKQVGATKAADGQKHSMIRPAREATMMRRLVEQGSSIFSSGIIYSIWRAIIAGSTQAEAPFTLSIYAPDESKTPYWLAREYFGSDTPCRFHNHTMALLHEAATNPNVVGIVPLMEQKNRPWWVELSDMPNHPHIFAILPFIGKIPFAVPQVFALAQVQAEASGNDITLAVVSDAKSISRESIQQHFMKNGIPSRDIFKHEEGAGNNQRRHQLFELSGFFIQDSAEIKTITASLNALNTADTPLTISVIGQYGVA